MKKFCVLLLASFSFGANAASSADLVKEADQAALEADMMVAMVANNSPWLLIAGDEDSKYYINGESIELVKGSYTPVITSDGQPIFVNSYVKTWWKQSDNDGGEIKMQSISYCGHGLYKTIDGMAYDADNKPLYRVKPNQKAKAVIPESVMSLVYKHSCDLRF